MCQSKRLTEIQCDVYKFIYKLSSSYEFDCKFYETVFFKDAVTQVLDENKDLKWWFKDVKKSVLKLVDTAKGCFASKDEMLVLFHI